LKTQDFSDLNQLRYHRARSGSLNVISEIMRVGPKAAVIQRLNEQKASPLYASGITIGGGSRRASFRSAPAMAALAVSGRGTSGGSQSTVLAL
jgi:hypothetical protein